MDPSHPTRCAFVAPADSVSAVAGLVWAFYSRAPDVGPAAFAPALGWFIATRAYRGRPVDSATSSANSWIACRMCFGLKS